MQMHSKLDRNTPASPSPWTGEHVRQPATSGWGPMPSATAARMSSMHPYDNAQGLASPFQYQRPGSVALSGQARGTQWGQPASGAAYAIPVVSPVIPAGPWPHQWSPAPAARISPWSVHSPAPVAQHETFATPVRTSTRQARSVLPVSSGIAPPAAIRRARSDRQEMQVGQQGLVRHTVPIVTTTTRSGEIRIKIKGNATVRIIVCG